MRHSGNISLVLCILIIAFIAYQRLSSKKIAVVQMDRLVYEFQGMKDATKKYTDKVGKWSAQSDSMEVKLRTLLDEMKMDSINNDKTTLIKDQQKFYVLQGTYYEYRQKVEQKAQQEDKDMTRGVINKVNEYMKEYAENKGYDLIISNTQMQAVGYVNEATDVTNEVIAFANGKYENVN